MDLICAKFAQDNGTGWGREDDNVIVFGTSLKGTFGRAYAAINKTDDHVWVNIDMSDTEEAMFTPSSGKVSMVIPPWTLKYLGHTMADVHSETLWYSLTMESEVVEG